MGLGISFAADLVGFVNFWDRADSALSARRLRERKRIVKETSLLAESGDARDHGRVSEQMPLRN